MAIEYGSMSDDDLLAGLPSRGVGAPSPSAAGSTATRGALDFTRMSDDDLLAVLPAKKGQGGSAAENFGMGLLRGAKDVIDTGAQWLASGFDKIAGTDEGVRVKAMNDAGQAEFDRGYGGSTAASLGRVGGQIAATLPVGGAIGAGVKAAGAAVAAPRAVALGEAITSGGMRAGGAGMGTRVAGGAIQGGASAGLVDPDHAGEGALIGAALPAVVRGAGRVGAATQKAFAGPEVAPAVRAAAQAGQEVGYVVPPTQVAPTFVNRLMEGAAGKLSTAQNASAKNQQVTNRLAREALGVEELTPEAIAGVRARANAAYDALGQAGTFTTDVIFKSALSKVGASSKSFAQDFPDLVRRDVDGLVESLKATKQFDAQSGIEAIKTLRADATANARAFDDPGRKALGRVQHQAAAALEKLMERNLRRTGQEDLLASFRDARQTLARAYDIEKALNPVTGNVDAAKLAAALKKGKPLSDGLRQAAEFAQAFPKAVQTPERMGSLPQLSPLDWAAAAMTGAAGAGPLSAAALAVRPATRAAALSQPVQRRAVAEPVARGFIPLEERRAADLLGRVSPAALTDRDRG